MSNAVRNNLIKNKKILKKLPNANSSVVEYSFITQNTGSSTNYYSIAVRLYTKQIN